MMAIGVLAVIILFLIGLVVTSFAVQDKSDENVAAVHIAESEMNRWKARPYQEVAALATTPAPAVARISDEREYNCQITVTPLSVNNPDGRILHLTLRVEWTEATVVSQNGTKTERPTFREIQSIMAPGAAL